MVSTVYVLESHSDQADEWIDENVYNPPWARVGQHGVVVDHRYIGEIVAALIDNGLEPDGVDFTVCEG